MRKLQYLVAVASLLVVACAVVPVKPAADRLSRLPPFDRSAVDVDGELVRFIAATQGDQIVLSVVALKEKAGRLTYTYVGPAFAYQDGLLRDEPDARKALFQARAVSPFHQPVEASLGTGRVFCVLDRVPKGTGESPGYKVVLELYDTDPRLSPEGGLPWATVELDDPASEGKPHGRLGVHDATLTPMAAETRGLPAGTKGSLILDVLAGGPAERADIRPDDVLIDLGGQTVENADDLTRATIGFLPGKQVKAALLRGAMRTEVWVTLDSAAMSTTVVARNGAVAQVAAAWLNADGKLRAVSLVPPRPPLEALLQGKASRDWWPREEVATERLLNDALVDWKNQELPVWLRRVSPADLAKTVTMTEKGILALDVSIRVLKDKIDVAARNNQDLPGAGEVEQLMQQRKMLLGVVLQAMKTTAAQRPASTLQGG